MSYDYESTKEYTFRMISYPINFLLNKNGSHLLQNVERNNELSQAKLSNFDLSFVQSRKQCILYNLSKEITIRLFQTLLAVSWLSITITIYFNTLNTF